MSTETYSTLHSRLRAGQIVVSGEIAPPKGVDRAKLERMAETLRPCVDAINLTDNQRGIGRMSALGASIILQTMGLEPIMQMTCQNRNRIALQADALSAATCGVSNVLCMTGDHPRIGDHPDAKNVLDFNSFQLIRAMRTMRDDGMFQGGTPLKSPPRLFVGGVANPNIERIARLEKKIESGAEFIQTQILFDMDKFRQWMAEARTLGLHQQSYIIAGIMIVRRAKSARFLRDHLPGSRVPEWLIERMERAEDAEDEGKQIAAELTQEALSIEGVRGVHLMTVDWISAIPEVVERAGLAERPPAAEQAVEV